MDPCTQGILGASLATCFGNKKNMRFALICGTIGGLSPDLDVLIRSSSDPLLTIDYHRNFTHSIFFLPFGSLTVSILLFFFLKNSLHFKNIFAFVFLGMLTHGFLDACTTYGTTLFWPLSNERISMNIISIVDPVFTFTLIIFLFFCTKKKSAKFSRFGLAFSIFYLLYNFSKNQMVNKYVLDLANQRSHQIERLFIKPTIGNNILWRSIYQYDGKYFIDAVYMPLTKKAKHITGTSTKVIDKNTIFSFSKESEQRNDILRFSFFANDYIYIYPDLDYIIADLRYGTLPNDLNSLWGIKVKPENENQHVDFLSLRNFNTDFYKDFWNMLSGKHPPG